MTDKCGRRSDPGARTPRIRTEPGYRNVESAHSSPCASCLRQRNILAGKAAMVFTRTGLAVRRLLNAERKSHEGK